MRAIHGGKAKNDRIDAHKIAVLLRGGMLPQAYVYPPEMRATRDLLRRRLHFTRKRAELLTHIENTNSQYNLPAFSKKLTYRSNRNGVVDRFAEASVQKTIAVDLELIAFYDDLLRELEAFILRTANGHDANTLYRLRSVPGIGKILSLVILYEIHDIRRFARPQELASYARLVKCAQESAGKVRGNGGPEDRQRAPEVGLLRSRRRLPPQESRGPGLLRAPRPQARQGEGADGAGAQARSRRLPHLEARPGLRPGEVPEHLTQTRREAGEPDA
jgi:transposase